MEKEEIGPYIQMPRKMTESGVIAPKDLVIYAAILRHKNKDGKSYPSLITIGQESGANPKTVSKCISNLEAAGYISVERTKSKVNVYTILKHIDGFESFTHEFLDNKQLSFIEKSYFLATQEYMFLDSEGKTGTVKYNNTELSKKINMPYSTLRKCQDALVKKDFMTILPDGTKTYPIEEFNKAVVLKLKQHDDSINDLQYQLEQERRDKKELQRQVNVLTKEFEEFKRTHQPTIQL